ncbi:MAG TPA: hypothetical protein VJW76_02405 [Verrucomicrobiae bacterium]|nr:hypothetical protein [Verrucomicrobiae bacterium]
MKEFFKHFFIGTIPELSTGEDSNRKQPHQWALHLSIITVLLVLLFGRRHISHLLLPGFWLADTVGLRDLSMWAFGLIADVLLLYGGWYALVKGWSLISRRFRLFLTGYAALCLLTWWGLHAYRTRVDWTAYGLNPDRPGFQPQVVVLAGTFTWINDTARGQKKRGKGLFEIRMNGFDHYYCKRWHGRDWKEGSWYRLELVLRDFAEVTTLRQPPHTTRGGCGPIVADDQAIVLARRLWDKSGFVGANADLLIAEDRRWHRTEEFQKLQKVGRWLVPKKIVLTDRNERIETFNVRKVEFWTRPGDDWFERVKRKHYDRERDVLSQDLGEPGVDPLKLRYRN